MLAAYFTFTRIFYLVFNVTSTDHVRVQANHLPLESLHSDADLQLDRNIFLESALGYALSYILSISGPHIIRPASITILADNDYYSSNSHSQTNKSSRFQNFGLPLSKAHKTGLGSSAALVTAVTAAVLSFYLQKEAFDLTTETSKRRLHNLAQAAHCAAQGKVGSGFDVASAVHGSCLYRRFSPSILANAADPGSPGFTSALRDLIEESGAIGEWDTEIQRDAIKVSAGLRLVMCDVSCGSQTPGMVKKVLAWRKEHPVEADAIWTDLHEANTSLAKELKALAESRRAIGLERLRACFTQIRKGIRLMSEKSGVPIEPLSQTELLDACEKIEGVVGGVVPGAGGYDAIALLIEDKEQTVVELEKLFRTWKFEAEGGKGDVRMLGVREEMAGVELEALEVYGEWL